MRTQEVIMPVRNDVRIEFDEATGDYYAVWRPIVIGSGSSRHRALEDLRKAAHLGIDTFIDLKSSDIEAGYAMRGPGCGARHGPRCGHWRPFRDPTLMGPRVAPFLSTSW
jgi:hypothetical protein